MVWAIIKREVTGLYSYSPAMIILSCVADLCERPSVWLVQDGRAPRETQFPGYGRWVVLCSPNSDNYMEFVKGK